MTFDRYSTSAKEVLKKAYSACKQFKSAEIGGDHLLLALTQEVASIPAAALAFMNVNAGAVKRELERDLLSGASRDINVGPTEAADLEPHEMHIVGGTHKVLQRAGELRGFFGHRQVQPEHLLLAMLDCAEEKSMTLLDELGVNTTFLSRMVTSHVAKRDALVPETPSLRKIVVDGISELVNAKTALLEDLQRLETMTETRVSCPDKAEVAHLIFTAYVPDFLYTQLAYQRYLLEETLELLRRRAGTLDTEAAAAIVSSSAQSIRAEVRETIENIWSHELRSLAKLPDEVEYDLIGSIIEDLWWTHSEEIALNQGFDEAQDDHRRTQMLNLQKRRLEISQRFVKLRARLDEVIKQSFLKRSLA